MHNWSGNIEFGEYRCLRPVLVAELQRTIRSNEKVRPRGTAHSFNTIADTSGVAVSLDLMSRDMVISEERMSVSVGAASKYGEVADFLGKYGFALHNMASLPHISVAGAIATGTHGSGVGLGSLATAVQSLDIVDGTGTIRHLTPADTDFFYGSVVGLGSCGIVTRLELSIEPTYMIAQVVYPSFPRQVLYKNLQDIFSIAYSVSFFTTWNPEGSGEVWAKYREGQTIQPQLHGRPAATEKRHPIPDLDSTSCTEQLGTPGPWNERLPHFRMDFQPSAGNELQSEYFVSIDNAAAALSKLEGISAEISELILVTEIRVVAADEFWLSPSFQRDSVAIHFTWRKDPGVYELLPAIEEILSEFDARPHWGKIFFFDYEYLETVYPKYQEFAGLLDNFDPQGKFSNAMINSLFRKR